jgi:hypothetical protein
MHKGGYSGNISFRLLRILHIISRDGCLEFAIFQLPPDRSLPKTLEELPTYGWLKIRSVYFFVLGHVARIVISKSAKVVYTRDVNNDTRITEILGSSDSGFLVNRGGKILSATTLEAFKGVWINIHGGILPYYRGLDSHLWAARNQHFHHIGATAHIMGPKIDHGPILLTQRANVSARTLICSATKSISRASDELHLGIHKGGRAIYIGDTSTEVREGKYFGPMNPRPRWWRKLKDLAL